jgi:hypothetical protein
MKSLSAEQLLRKFIKMPEAVNFTRSFQPFHKHVSTFLTVNQAVKL